MIGRLTGTVVDQTLDGACVLDVHGVGYEVFIPLGALGRLPQPPAPTTLHVHTHVREDALILYGFPSIADRSAFRVLTSVSGVGPKLALAVLSSMSASELAEAVQRGDKARFKGVSGVGPKIVSRLVLELKDKLDFARGDGASTPIARSKPSAVAEGPLATVQAALVQMGFRASEAELALSKIEPAAEGKPAEQLLREALAVLA